MKKANGILLVLIGLLGVAFCATALAGQVNDQQSRSIYDAIKMRGEFLPHENNMLEALKAGTTYLLISDTTYSWDGLNWGNSSRTTYTYNG